MEQIGVVIKTEKNHALVSVNRTSACGENCAHCKGGCVPSKVTAQVQNQIGASVGDIVKIESDSKDVIKAAVFLYLMPCILAIFGAVLTSIYTPNPWAPAAAAIFILLLSFFVIRKFDKLLAPVCKIVKIINAKSKEV